jgi:hypothetical protein
VIFDIVENIMMEWTMPNRLLNPNMQDMHIGQKHIAGRKTKQGRLRVRQVLFF